MLNNLEGLSCRTDGPVKELGTILNIARQCTQVSTHDYIGTPVGLGASYSPEMIRLYKAKVELEDIFELVGNSRYFYMAYSGDDSKPTHPVTSTALGQVLGQKHS